MCNRNEWRDRYWQAKTIRYGTYPTSNAPKFKFSLIWILHPNQNLGQLNWRKLREYNGSVINDKWITNRKRAARVYALNGNYKIH